MKRKITLLTAVMLCAASAAAGVAASEFIREIKAELRPDFTIVIDGEVKNFKNVNGEKVYPVLYDGTTYLPVRAIGEMMGKTVYWYEQDKKIEFKETSTTVTDADVIISGNENKSTDEQNPQIIEKTEKSQVNTADFIGEENAKIIALEYAALSENDVVFQKVKLDEDDGFYHYEIEFKKGFVEYEADISATDGKIISWEVDN